MTRTIQVSLLLAMTLSLPLTLGGCEKKEKGETTNPDEAEGEEGGDPVEELKAIPTRLQAEVDSLLKPIADAEKFIADLEAIPAKYNISAKDFQGLVKASFDSETGTVEISADLKVAEEAKAELQATLAQLKEIKVALETYPDRVKVVLENVIKIGADAVALSAKAASSLTAKAKVAMGEKKAEIEAQIAEVATLKDQIMGEVEAAKTQVTELPARAAEVGVSFTASFAAG